MSRFIDGENDDEFWALDQGRWRRNARATLKSKRGRKALAEIREALLALPEKRLIEGALCTVGGPERVPVPEVTDADIEQHVATLRITGLYRDDDVRRERAADYLRKAAGAERDAVAENVAENDQGAGVCVNGALLWHRLVKEGKAPDEAFAALPSLANHDEGDPLWQTAKIAEQDAGIALTLAWELAYRNDETYRAKTPEERYEAFLGWINAELGDAEPAAAGGARS